MSRKQVYIYKDKEAVGDLDGFLFYYRIGMVLPLIEEDANNYTLPCSKLFKTGICHDIQKSKLTNLSLLLLHFFLLKKTLLLS